MAFYMSYVLLGWVGFLGFAGDGAGRMHFPQNGFSITPLEGPSGDTPYQSLMMFLPATQAFAPNVNLQIQPYSGSIKDYTELSDQQFKDAGVRILHENLQANDVVWEYAGTYNDRQMHWYARAYKRGNKVYLITATALESQWSTVSRQLRACVDSFRLD
ncbi:MAG: hypothetical protein H6510_01660 [Acidobacteria bacterium]|nr:hypothetical protein [Acidobacteriota bacterium]MCB9396497.1 hypothetical protein [Acidobacteriota bacterium]